MSAPKGRRPAESPSCPLLGLPDDPFSRFSYPSVAHRCRSDTRPRTIDLGHQGAFCLGGAYPECARYRAAAAASRRRGTQTAVAPGSPPQPETHGVALERVTPEAGRPDGGRPDRGRPDGPAGPGRHEGRGGGESPDEPAGPGRHDDPDGGRSSGRTGRRRRRWSHIAIIVLVTGLLAFAAYLASPSIADWMRQVRGGAAAASPVPTTAAPSPVPTTAVLQTAVPSPSATPARTPPPMADPTAMPTAKPTATPTPIPAWLSTPRVHVVVRGETLIAIAARYGVTVVAIKDANGLKDPGLIYVGQQLVIPSP